MAQGVGAQGACDRRGRGGDRRAGRRYVRPVRDGVGGGQANASLSGLPALLSFVLAFGYYILMEGYLGQTLGKMLLGIKLVREDTGGVPGLKAAVIRTLLRIVDGFSYLVAFVAVLASQKNRRLGDMAAHTLVVRK